MKARKGKEVSNLVGRRFPPFCRACLSLFSSGRESEEIDYSRKWWGWYAGETGVSKRTRKRERSKAVSCFSLGQTFG